MKGGFDFRTIVSGFVAAAVVFALSIGGATAASLINGNSIRNHTIGVIKLKKNAVQALRGQRGARGAIGPAGPGGPAGPQGPPGRRDCPGRPSRARRPTPA